MSIGGSGSKSKSVPGAIPQYTGGQFDVLNALTGLLTGQIGQGVQSYPGQITPGTSGLQQQGFQTIQDMLAGGGGMGEATNALSSLMGEYDPTQAMDYWTKAVKEPAMRTWTEEMIPQIQEKFGAQNALGSSAYGKTLAKSGSDLASNLAGTLAQTMLGEKGQWAQNQLGAVSGYGDLMSNLLNQTLGAGTTQRGIEGEQLGEGYQKWMTEQGYSNPWLNFLSTILGAQPYQVAQESQSKSFGGQAGTGSCCFIVIQGEGTLTENVRYVRDLIINRLQNVTIAKGYKRLASILVPMMKRSKFVHHLVRLTMTRPISIFSDWFIQKKMAKILLIPIGLFWLSVFNAIGGGRILNIPKTTKIMLGG